MSKVYVAGASMIPFGKYPDASYVGLALPPVAEALKMTGLRKDQVGAVYCGHTHGGPLVAQRICKEIGLGGIPMFNVENACSSSGAALNLAVDAIRAGRIDAALVIGVEKLTKFKGGPVPLPDEDLEVRSGVVMPAVYAMRAQRYLHDTDATVEKHGHLIWASISGFGQIGPYRDKPAYDMIVQAMSGVMSVTGEPGRQPVRLGIPAGDTVAGLYALVGLLSVLSDVRRGGKGRWIDISMLDVQRAMLSYQATYSLNTGEPVGRQGAGHDFIPTYRSFVGADGAYFVVTANTQRMWERMCAAIGRPDLARDERFSDLAHRLQNKQALWQVLEPAFRSKRASDWVAILEASDVPCALINDTTQALNAPDVECRGIVAEVTGAREDSYKTVVTPIRIVGVAAHPNRFPPHLGEHQDDGDLQ